MRDLTRSEPGHDLDELFDREGLAQHRRHSELFGLFGSLLESGADDDRRGRIALFDATNSCMCAGGVISVETDEVSDDEIWFGVGRGLLKTTHQQQLVTLIAQHLAKEVSSGAVVVDDQDLNYSRQGGGSAPGPQF